MRIRNSGLALVMVLLACQRAGTRDLASNDTSVADGSAGGGLEGTWELVRRSGGYAGKTDSLITGERLVVSDSTATYYKGDSVVSQGRFTVTRVKSIFTGEMADALKVGENGIPEVITLQGDTLFLSANCYDCFNSTYVRVK